MTPFISVVIPVLNEKNYIEACLESLLEQTYPKESMEWIFVDGMSHDGTKEILDQWHKNHPGLIRVFENPQKTVPFAMNKGIVESKGKYIVRMDVHSTYYPDYIEKCVHYLETTDAMNVGGMAETKSRGAMGAIITKVLSSPFGVGNSQFRIGGKGGEVDTVPFGAFRREVFDQVGLYDERLTRNQDNELNFRIRKAGGKILLFPDIRFIYYGRETVASLLKMARTNGYWNVLTMKIMPGSMGLRHFIPFLFLLSLIVLPLLGLVHPFFWWLLLVEAILYLALAAYFSAKQADNSKEFFWILFLFPLFHIHYGWGSLKGIIRTFIVRNAWSERNER